MAFLLQSLLKLAAGLTAFFLFLVSPSCGSCGEVFPIELKKALGAAGDLLRKERLNAQSLDMLLRARAGGFGLF